MKAQKKSIAIICITVLFTTFYFTNCKKERVKPIISDSTSISEDLAENSSSRTIPNYSGREIFRGIFFLRGAFKAEILSYSNVNPYYDFTTAQLATLDGVHNTILNQLEIDNPNIFNTLKTEIKSGVPSRINISLDNCAKAFAIALKKIPSLTNGAKVKPNSPFIKKESTIYSSSSTNGILISNPELLCDNALCEPQIQGFAVGMVFFFAAAVHNTVALTANALAAASVAAAIGLWVWKYKYFWGGSASYVVPVGVPGNIPVEYRKLYDLKYDAFIQDISTIYTR